tara:strand:- start:632 stop:1075 length:444 start_codon:yes stop_codon:yes gene_type:complete
MYLKLNYKNLLIIFLTVFQIYSCSKGEDDGYGSDPVVEENLSGYILNVSAENNNNYIVSGADKNGSVSGNDPDITISVGETINFVVRANGHPFYLKTEPSLGRGDLVSGATNQGTTNRTVTWTPTSSGTYYYVCSLHDGMYGVLTVE